MQRFKKIILLLNSEIEGKPALDKAISLARQNRAKLTLFSVLKEIPSLQRGAKSVVRHQLASAIAERREWLRGQLLPINTDNIEVVINVVLSSKYCFSSKQRICNNELCV